MILKAKVNKILPLRFVMLSHFLGSDKVKYFSFICLIGLFFSTFKACVNIG